MVDAPVGQGWLVDRVRPEFTLLCFDQRIEAAGVTPVALESIGLVAKRYDARPATSYLIRPDRYVAARWRRYDPAAVQAALMRASGL